MSDLNNLNQFRETIAAGRVCIGCGVSLNDPTVSELIAEAGYDFVWIDLEHSVLSVQAALGHVRAVRGTNTAPFIRVPWNDPVLLKPVLELAPAAVIVPMVRNADEAARAVSACKYPPNGIRGFGPSRGIRFGGVSIADYLTTADSHTLVIVQIEHIDAARNLEQILQTPGIDGICVGPNDFSGSMGKLGQTQDPEVRSEIVRILRTARAAGKLPGIATGFDAESFKLWLDSGVQWISMGADWINMAIQSRDTLVAARQIEMKGRAS